MKYIKPFLLLLAAFFMCLVVRSQSAIGVWKDYLNYSRTIDVDILNEKVYTATRNAVFIYNTDDNSLERLSKVNGLSDIDIVLVSTYAPTNTVFIGYANGNMDIINGSNIRNFAEIKNSSVVGDKSIRQISYSGNTAFISTGVGILEFDLERIEVRDTYTIVPSGNLSVNETTVLNDTLFAATNDGLFYGSLETDLTIFSNWNLDLSTPDPFGVVRNCTSQNGQLYLNLPTANLPALYLRKQDFSWLAVNGTADISVVKSSPGGLVLTTGYYTELKSSDNETPEVSFTNYNGELMQAVAVTASANGTMWVADARKGLVKRNMNNTFEFIHPDGPASNGAFDLDFKSGQLWVSTGATERPGTWNNTFKIDGFYGLVDNTWKNYTRITNPELEDQLFFDMVKIYIDPDNENRIYVGSFFSGFTILEDGEITGFYTDTNTSLGERTEYDRPDDLSWVGVAGIAKDRSNNMWFTNAFSSEPLSVQTPSGTWKSFNLLGADGLSTNKVLLDMIIDQQDQKWAIINKGGVVVFSSGSSIADESDDKVRLMTAQIGSGGLPSNEVICLTEDLDGEIWMGTTEGIAVFYSPFDALTDNFSDARRILVEQDGVFQYLLEGQAVTAIAIDGANRKWIGTFGAGVFLMSEDGTEEVRRFTAEDSPLVSNMVNDIVIDPVSGEVFIATQEGIVSYISDATAGLTSNECTTVYPNPVRENYTGPIAISGLLRDSEIRITDTRGNLIFKTVSNGGKAIWDGKNTNGERVATGVYFALSSDVEGNSTCVSKILVIK